MTPENVQGSLPGKSNPLVAGEELHDWIKNVMEMKVRREHDDDDDEDGGALGEVKRRPDPRPVVLKELFLNVVWVDLFPSIFPFGCVRVFGSLDKRFAATKNNTSKE